MRSRVPAVVLAALLLLAGCTGGTPAPSPTTTATPTGTPTETVTQSPSATSTVEPGSVVDYADLNSQQQDAFRDAIGGETSFVPNTSYVNDAAGYDFEQVDPFREHEYVRYEGSRYRISLHQGGLYASYQIWASTGSPDDDDTVVMFEDLPADVRDEVETAVTAGEYYAPAGKWDSLPASLAEAEYVRYGNETYEMSYAVGDAWADVLTVERVE